MINTLFRTTMANQLGKANSKLGQIHAGKVAINDMGFLDSIVFTNTYYPTYFKTLNDSLAINDSLIPLKIHIQVINEEPLDIQEILMYDTDYIFNKFFNDTLNLQATLTLQTYLNRSFNQSLIFNERLLPVLLKTINDSINYNQTITTLHIHNASLRQNLLYSSNFNTTIRHLWSHITDNLQINSLVFIDTPKFVLISKSGAVFGLPTPLKSIIENLRFRKTYKTMELQVFTFDVSPDQLIPFKQFLNYYRFDPFTLSDTVNTYLAYLHHSKSNREALDMFNTSTTVTLTFHALLLN